MDNLIYSVIINDYDVGDRRQDISRVVETKFSRVFGHNLLIGDGSWSVEKIQLHRSPIWATRHLPAHGSFHPSIYGFERLVSWLFREKGPVRWSNSSR